MSGFEKGIELVKGAKPISASGKSFKERDIFFVGTYLEMFNGA